ncbi:MAG: tape measure protein [Bacteroidota bacterium]
MANKLYEYVVRIVDRASASIQRIQGAARNMDNQLNTVARTAQKMGVALGLAFGASQIVAYGNNALQTTAKVQGMQNAIVFASGSAQEGATNLKFLSDTSERLGLNQLAATDGFRTLAGSMIGTGFTADQTRSIFTNVSTATTAMGLSSEDAQATFLALGQIMSKGKVSAEELRGQIGERIPGAFGIAAKAMGLTTQQLDKMMSSGKLASKDFIIPFTEALREQFEGALPKATQSLQANLNRLENGLLDLKTTLITQFLPDILSVVKVLRTDFIPAVKTGFGYLRSAVTWVQDHSTALKALGVALSTATFSYGGFMTITKISTWWTGASTAAIIANTFATKGLTAGMLSLNAAMVANPIGILIAAAAVLAAGFYLLWTKCDKFRATITALWEVTKNFFKGVYHLLHGFHTGNFEEMRSAFHQIGIGSAEAWQKGWKNGMEDFQLASMPSLKEQYGDENPLMKQSRLGGHLNTKAVFGNGKGNTGAKDSKLAAGLAQVSDGGKKQTTINITIGKFQDKTEIHTTNLTEGVKLTEDMFIDMFIRVLNGASQSYSQ